MNRKVLVSMTVFFSLLLVGAAGVNVVFVSAAAPSWHPLDGDIGDWDLRWEGSLNSSITGINFGYFIGSSLFMGSDVDAWGQIWTQNESGLIMDAAALVFLIDVGQNYWDRQIPATTWAILQTSLFDTWGDSSSLGISPTVWTVFAWFVDQTINGSMGDAGFNVTDKSSASTGYDHAIVVNGSFSGNEVEFLMGTEGEGLIFGLTLYLNDTYAIDLNTTMSGWTHAEVIEWLLGNFAYIAMLALMILFMVPMIVFSAIFMIMSFSSTSTTTQLSTLADESQEDLTDIAGSVSAVASSKGFGVPATTPPIPGFEILFILVPLGLLMSYFVIRSRRKEII